MLKEKITKYFAELWNCPLRRGKLNKRNCVVNGDILEIGVDYGRS